MNLERDDGLSLPPPPAQRRGGIVRRSFAVAGEHWKVGAAAVFVLVLPVSLLGAFLDREFLEALGRAGLSGDPVMDDTSNPVVDLVEGLFFAPWAIAAALLVVVGRAHAIGDALSAGLRRLPHTLGAGLLAGVIAMLPLLPAFVLFAVNVDEALDGMGPGMAELGGADFPAGLAVAGVLFLAGLVPSVFLGLSLALAVPLAVADGLGSVAALKASWRRMPGQRLRLLGGMLGLVLPATFVVSLLSLPLGLLALALGPGGGWVLSGLIDAVLVAVLTVVVVSVYAVVRADTAPWDAPVPGDPEARWEAPAS